MNSTWRRLGGAESVKQPLRDSPYWAEGDCPADSSPEEGKACPVPFQRGRVANIPSPRHFLKHFTYIWIHVASNVIQTPRM